MSESKTCGSCFYCVTEEGSPYYCALRDLYYFITPNDKACASYTPDRRGMLHAALIKEIERSIGGKVKRLI